MNADGIQTKWIITTKATFAERKVNAFIAEINENNWKLVDIKPLMAFSGPSCLIGAMITYLKEENDGFDNTEEQC